MNWLVLCDPKVLAITCDGASPNRKFLRMHHCDSLKASPDCVTFRVENPFIDGDGQYIHFISDVPRLIKTTPNLDQETTLGKYISIGIAVIRVYNCTSSCLE